MPPDLIGYIKNSLAQGVLKPAVEANLIRVDWKKEQIDAGFQQLESDKFSTASVKKSIPPWKLLNQFEAPVDQTPDKANKTNAGQIHRILNWFTPEVILIISSILTFFFTKHYLSFKEFKDVVAGSSSILCGLNTNFCLSGAILGTLTMLSWVLIVPLPGIILVSILRDWKRLPLAAILISGLPNALALFILVITGRPIIFLGKITFLAYLKSFLTVSLPSALILYGLIYGLSLIIFNLIKNHALFRVLQIILKVELGVFLLLIVVQLLSPKFSYQLDNLINRELTGQIKRSISTNLKASPAHLTGKERVAFVSNKDGQIYLTDEEGGNKIRLTNLNVEVKEPRWSPDGTKIAFACKFDNTSSDICLINSDGTNFKRLTNNGYNTRPLWSPDGNLIVFNSSEGGGNLHAISPDGSNLTDLTNHEASDDFWCWSPDGKRVLFSSVSKGPQVSLNLIDTDGRSFKTILTLSSSDSIDTIFSTAKWSLDGKNILFTTLKGSLSDRIIAAYVADSDGSNVKIFSQDLMKTHSTVEGYPDKESLQFQGRPEDWSPDKKFVIFQINDKYESDIYITDSETKIVKNLTGDLKIQTSTGPTSFTRRGWSPDGKKIMFNSPEKLYTLNSDGSDLKVVSDDFDILSIRWLPIHR